MNQEPLCYYQYGRVCKATEAMSEKDLYVHGQAG